MLANPLCCREVAEACKIESLGFPIEEADPHAAGDTCQEAEAKLNREGRLPRRPYCFEDHEYQRAGRRGCPTSDNTSRFDVLVRIAQIEQMTLDQIAVFQRRILTEITTGRIAPREASAIDRALRRRLNAIEQELREGG